MCDDFTAEADAAALVSKGLNRRQFAAISAAGVLAACAGSESEARPGEVKIKEGAVSIATPDGMADGFFAHPARGKHPGIILWPDIAGLRGANMEMARRLARAGYAVLVPNHYYRTMKGPIFNVAAEWRTPEGQAKLAPALKVVSPAGTTRDAKAFVAWLDAQKAVDRKRGIGSNGYCMTGSYTIIAAAAVPERVRAACSFHGGGLVTEAENSPHRLMAQTKASFLIAIARNDDAKAPTDKDALRAAADAAKRPAEIEVYNADHGWCTLDSPVYDKAEADRAWGRMLALYAKL